MIRQVVASVLGIAVSITALEAHVVVTPRESAPGAQETYTVRVPTEGTVATTSIELEVPEGLHVIDVPAGDGFTVDVRKDASRIVAIIWKREIKPKEFALFTFTGRNPQAGTLQWKAHQTFADGSVRHWIGERGAKEPASLTTIAAKIAKPAPAGDHKH